MNKHDRAVHGAILRPEAAERSFRLRRIAPPPDLGSIVVHFWFIDWALEQPHTQSVLPFPAANWVSEVDRWEVSGVQTRRYDRHLEGTGSVYGVLFQPTGLYALWPEAQHALVDATRPLEPVPAARAHQLLRSLPDDARRAEWLASQLREQVRQPPDDERHQLDALVHLAKQHRDWTRVEQLAAHTTLSVRTLQRRFRRYIGLSPKQVLRRFRLQEAAAALAEHPHFDGAALAYRLGYADQAHLIRDFKRIVGQTPDQYRRGEPR